MGLMNSQAGQALGRCGTWLEIPLLDPPPMVEGRIWPEEIERVRTGQVADLFA
jgi:hypothetical protein